MNHDSRRLGIPSRFRLFGTRSSARTLTKDSHILQDVRVWRHGPDCQCYRRSRRSTITRGRIRRGVFKSVAELEDAITRYIKAHNKTSEPFVWTATAPAIFEKLNQIPVPSE